MQNEPVGKKSKQMATRQPTARVDAIVTKGEQNESSVFMDTPASVKIDAVSTSLETAIEKPIVLAPLVMRDWDLEMVKACVSDMDKEDLLLVAEACTARNTSGLFSWILSALQVAHAFMHDTHLDAPNLSGSARTEGFRKLTMREKKMHSLVSIGTASQRAAMLQRLKVVEESRATRVEQRRYRGTTEEWQNVELLKYNQLKFRRKKLKFGRSPIHGWGLFTMEPIPANEMVVEYVGELIRPITADHREVRYTEQGIGSSYLFRLGDSGIIDATRAGAVGRFMNHSCNPNCTAKIVLFI